MLGERVLLRGWSCEQILAAVRAVVYIMTFVDGFETTLLIPTLGFCARIHVH